MPNHCDQDLRVTCEEKHTKELRAFYKFAQRIKNGKKEYLPTEKFIPYPKRRATINKKIKDWVKKNKDKKEYECPQKDWFNSGGYDWCLKNWGTKWGIYECELVGKDFKYCELSYNFNSAWSPAKPIIMAMSKKFPNLTFDLSYFDCGAMFNGWYQLKAGEEIEDRESEYFGSRGG